MPNQRGNAIIYGILIGLFIVGGIFVVFNLNQKKNDLDLIDNHPTTTYQIDKTIYAKEKLVILGGRDNDSPETIKSLSKRVEIYNPKTNQWSETTPLNFQYIEAAAVSIGSKIYIFGNGIDNNLSTPKAEVYDSTSDKWTEISSPPFSFPTEINAYPWTDKIYLIHSNNTKSDLHSYNLDSEVYQKLKSPPKIVSNCFSQYANIYCFLRGDGTKLIKYEPKNDSWEETIIENRKNVYAVTGFQNDIYAITTDDYGNKSITMFNVEKARFNDVSSSLTKSSPKFVDFGFGQLGSYLVIAGGVINEKGKRILQDDVTLYDFRQMPIELPKMRSLRVSPLIATLPIESEVLGGVISGKITTSTGSKLTNRVYITLYKITSKHQDGSTSHTAVNTQNVDSQGNFKFSGLDEGGYTLAPGGGYSTYRHETMPELKIVGDQIISNIEIIAESTQ